MTALNLVLVEDDDSQVQTYEEVLEEYKKRSGRAIYMSVCKKVNHLHMHLNPSVDAVVIDLNLGRDTRDGAKVIDELKPQLRVPVVVFTGTPADADDDPPVVKVFTKGRHGFDDVLDCVWNINSIGLTRIMGGRGLLEDRLNKVFHRNLLPTLDVWLRYGTEDVERTERALLRFALGHLVADLEGDATPCYPEEVYLAPPPEDSLTTGSLVKSRDNGVCHVVLTPACDLVLRNGTCKAKTVALAEVVSEDNVLANFQGNAEARRNKQERLRNNNDAYCFHWLPTSGIVNGGFLDFQQLQTVAMDQLEIKFEIMQARIAPTFVKDIVSRFSAFYARQGQPVIN